MNEKRRRASALMMKYYSGMIDEGTWRHASGDIAVFNTKYRRNLKSLIVQLEPIQAGSGNPAPDNVRPISGRTGATVYHTGGNLYDKNATNPSNGYVSGSYLVSNGNEIALASWSISEYIVIDETDVILSIPSGYAPAICFYDENKDYISGISYQNRKTVQITAPTSAKYARISVPSNSVLDTFRLAYGTNIDITWATEAGTVYGGTIDVISGKLTVNRIMFARNTAEMNNSEAYPGWRNTGLRNLGYTGQGIMPNQLMNIGTEFGYNTNTSDVIYLRQQTYGLTQSEWVTAAMDIQIIIPLITDMVYQLTPQQIQTLIGENVIWSDAGPVSVEYWS